jgi:hypothetical protein
MHELDRQARASDGWMPAHHLTGPGMEAFREVETSGKTG